MNQTVKPALAVAPSTATNQAAYLSGFGNGF